MKILLNNKWSNLTTLKNIILLLVLSSCSVTKNLNKQTTKEISEIKTETTTTRTITEVATQTIEVKADTIKTDKNIDLILQGDSIYEDTPGQTITVKVVKGKLTAKAIKKKKIVTANVNRTIIENSHESKLARDSKQSTVKTKQVERKGINLNYIWWLLLLIPLWIGWRYIK